MYIHNRSCDLLEGVISESLEKLSISKMTTPEEKYELITRRLQEVFGGDSIKAILAEGRQPKCYWGAYDLNLSYLIYL